MFVAPLHILPPLSSFVSFVVLFLYLRIDINKKTYQRSNRQSSCYRGHRARLNEADCAACGGEGAEDEGCLVEGLENNKVNWV